MQKLPKNEVTIFAKNQIRINSFPKTIKTKFV